jgi:hypothetical protein
MWDILTHAHFWAQPHVCNIDIQQKPKANFAFL